MLTTNPLRRPSTGEILSLDLFLNHYGTADKTAVTQMVLSEKPPHIPVVEGPMDTGYFADKNKARNFDIPQ